MTTISAEAPLTPSELILLRGERFAPKAALFNKTRLIHMEMDVSAPVLAQAMLAAAFLANQQVGTLKLEAREKKGLFGLSKRAVLYAEPLRITNWPEGSLEAALLSLSSQQKSNGERNNISGIIYTLLKEDSPDPGEKVISFVKYGLAARGLLETETKTTLKIFMSTKFILPDSTRLLVEKSPIEAIQALLDDCERQQPRGWEMLNDEIKKGLAERQEKPDTDIDD